jgi:pyruvate/2-oxoglutarate dehydrogenase complex dihydrolipoamide acyltransferase (E2) component
MWGRDGANLFRFPTRRNSVAPIVWEGSAVPADETTVRYRKKRLSAPSLILSACLNLLLVLALLREELLWTRWDADTDREVAVELVPEPAKPAKPAAPSAAEEPKPEAPKVEAPKPEAPKPEPPKPQVVEQPPPPPPPPRPPPPQLVPAPLAQHSTAPRRAAPEHAEKAKVLGDGPGALAVGRDAKVVSGAEEEGPELTQTEQDMVLAQIMKYWHVDTHVPQAHGLVLQAKIVIRADGTLASPLNRNDPWNPEEVISGYNSMVREGYSFRREAIEGFLLALRVCQPLKLPPGGTWPRHMTLRLALDDL